jgi:uroporphyrinogen-III synthase
MHRPIYLTSITPANDPDIVELPLLRTTYFDTPLPLEAYDGLILTSKQAVEAVERIDPAWKKLPVLCVGKATQRRAEALGATVLERSDGYGAGLYDIVKARHADRRWLYARPKVVASDFAERLRADGIDIGEAIVYETGCAPETPEIVLPSDAILIFTSPSSLKCFQQHFRIEKTHDVVVIGRTTAAALERHPRIHLASEPGVAACVTLAKTLGSVDS